MIVPKIKFDAPMPASPYDPHPCILCGNTFVSERHMNRHLLTHTDIKRTAALLTLTPAFLTFCCQRTSAPIAPSPSPAQTA